MTGLLFMDRLQNIDASIKVDNQMALLLLNYTIFYAHRDLYLTNAELLSLSLNTASKTQPMDAERILTFKRRYRRYQFWDALDKEEPNRVDIYRVDQLTMIR